ncbi:hypothetical protein ABT56_14350 [Photobacterium aquae]|uniref:ClbS/DfsB family four-helix bundle protein n=1 Tax=Photobacterium aquae TaxID=1195763 RepID=A0A0J1GYB1_9GAMM|nr:ClbS/DfsB family four-helix bundle protein [Photobacterium aquae]KLV04638.1 hypothetical protein ABT56_14350 [Photobacterium aquae]
MSSIPSNKAELESAIETAFAKLLCDYQSIPVSLAREKALEGNTKGTQISVCDTLAYLIGWGQLVLKWHHRQSQGLPVDFPETGYKWNQLGSLAAHFHQQYEHWDYSALLDAFEQTTAEILQLISALDDNALYGSPWYGKWTLGRMIQFNTSSPMKTIRTKVRRFNKQQVVKLG